MSLIVPTRARTLRVAVGLDLPRRRKTYGHGRVWLEVLSRLSKRVRLELVEPRYLPRRLRPLRRPDVWLVNGGAAPPPVDGPAVVYFHEVCWHRPELGEHVAPEFLERHARAGDACMQFATRALTSSQAGAQDISDAYAFPLELVDVVALGVDSRRFRPVQGGAELVAREAGSSSAPYVLHVASLLPRKNLVGLRAAMAALAARGFAHRLVVVGGGSPDRSDVDELASAAFAELPGAPGRIVRISFPQPERRLVQLMSGAAAFCLPSFYEGFGLTALEAMACGAPVIVSDRGSLPEVVGDAGVIVDPSPEGIEQGLEQVLSDPARARAFGAAARARATALSWERTADGWAESLYRAAEQAA